MSIVADRTLLRMIAAIALLAAAWAGPAGAQGETPVFAVYRLTAFGSGPLASESFSNTPGGESVRAARMHVSNPVKAALRDGSLLDFYAEDAEAGQPPLCSVRVPASNRSDLLVVLMVQEGKIKPLLIDLKAIRLQRGGQFFYNLLPVAVAVQCGEGAKPLAIQPGKTGAIAAPAADKVIQTLYYSDAEGKPVKFSSSIFFKDEGARQIVFCYAEKGAPRPKVAPICIYDHKVTQPGRP